MHEKAPSFRPPKSSSEAVQLTNPPGWPAAVAKEALLHTLAECEQRGMQALSAALLAGLDGVGPQLLQHPAAVGAVLGQLAAAVAAAGEQQQRQGAEAGEGAEAAWALCSALAAALSQRQQQDAAAVAPVLAVLEQHAGVLCHDFWTRSSGSSRVLQHQAYTLQRLAPLLEQRPVGQALEAALERCQTGQAAP